MSSTLAETRDLVVVACAKTCHTHNRQAAERAINANGLQIRLMQ